MGPAHVGSCFRVSFSERFGKRFWPHLGSQVGAMLATFSAKTERWSLGNPRFCCFPLGFHVFGSSQLHLGPIVAPFWTFSAPSWLHLGFILLVFGSMLARFWCPVGTMLHLPTYLPTYLPNLPTYLPTYLCTYVRTYVRTYVITYVPKLTYLCTYVHIN